MSSCHYTQILRNVHDSCTLSGMDLKTYIKQLGGPLAFTKKHGWITYRSAIAYSCGARRPQPETARRLIAESPVTWEGIYGPAKPQEVSHESGGSSCA